MHRTQIILEDWQHQALKARAEQEGRSMSDLIRELLSKALSQPQRKRPRVATIEGVGEDPAAYGRDHDELLYGKTDKR